MSKLSSLGAAMALITFVGLPAMADVIVDPKPPKPKKPNLQATVPAPDYGTLVGGMALTASCASLGLLFVRRLRK